MPRKNVEDHFGSGKIAKQSRAKRESAADRGADMNKQVQADQKERDRARAKRGL